MLPLLLAWLGTAQAGDDAQTLTWSLTVDDKPVGERTVTIRTVPGDRGDRRVIEAWTQVDATAIGQQFSFKQRMTAHAAEGPASFHSVLDENGSPREVQGRLTGGGWMVTVVDNGRSRSWDLPARDIDLSTADLLDPSARVSLTRLDTARVLSVETGAVWSGRVERLGSSEISIAGEPVPIEGYAFHPPEGRALFYYTSDGYLVRYEMSVLGKQIAGQLTTPPPTSADDLPIQLVGAAISEQEI